LIGHRVFAPEFGGIGKLVGGDEDGGITLLSSIDDPTGPGMVRQWRGEKLLVVGFEDDRPSSDPQPEPARGNWFRRALGLK
jgi:hypothetical protein